MSTISRVRVSGGATTLMPSTAVRPDDIVFLDDSRTPYRLLSRDAIWVIFGEIDGADVTRAHVDDLVECIRAAH